MGSGASGQDRVIEAEVCIVGAGPVGLTLAVTLATRGATVALLESGRGRGALDAPAADDLLDGPVEGATLASPWRTRARGLGGTARIWNTLVAEAITGKYIRLDPVDFEARPGNELGGWPIGRGDLAPFYDRAAVLCGVHPSVWRETGLPGTIRRGGLETGFHGFGPRRRFTDELPARIEALDEVTLVPGATAAEILVSPGGARVRGVVWRGSRGERGTVRAGTTVLAAGALENARLLLLPAARLAVWSELEWIGRGLMEHPVDRSMTLRTRARELTPDPGLFGPHRVSGAPESPPVWRMGKLGLDAERIRGGGLPNHAVRFMTPDGAEWIRRWVPAGIPRRAAARVMREGSKGVRRLQGAFYRLHVDLEQRPHPENRVVLAADRNGLGLRRVALLWRWRAEDEADHVRLVEALTGAFTEAALGPLERMPGVSVDPDAHHHAGTTRMHPDRDLGVVDPTLRVHGTENLFVCGSSVFPTAGFANPTLTAVALALRLTDHLVPAAHDDPH